MYKILAYRRELGPCLSSVELRNSSISEGLSDWLFSPAADNGNANDDLVVNEYHTYVKAALNMRSHSSTRAALRSSRNAYSVNGFSER